MPDTFSVCSCVLSGDFYLDERKFGPFRALGGQGLRFAVWRAGTGLNETLCSALLPPINELSPHKSWIAVKERFSPKKALINPRKSHQ